MIKRSDDYKHWICFRCCALSASSASRERERECARRQGCRFSSRVGRVVSRGKKKKEETQLQNKCLVVVDVLMLFFVFFSFLFSSSLSSFVFSSFFFFLLFCSFLVNAASAQRTQGRGKSAQVCKRGT